MDRIDPPELARRLIRARKTAGLTQVGLADKARKSPATISGLESGKIARPHLGTILDLAEALGVEHTELTGEATPTPKGPPPRSMGELLERVGARTRYLALEETEFGELWDGKSAEERRELNRDVLEEARLVRPHLVRWKDMSASEERSRLYEIWKSHYFLRTAVAAERSQRAAMAEADATRQRGDEVRATRLLEEASDTAKEFAGVA